MDAGDFENRNQPGPAGHEKSAAGSVLGRLLGVLNVLNGRPENIAHKGSSFIGAFAPKIKRPFLQRESEAISPFFRRKLEKLVGMAIGLAVFAPERADRNVAEKPDFAGLQIRDNAL